MAFKLFKSRAETRAQNNLGIINLSGEMDSGKYRSTKLHKLDRYYDNTVYDSLMDWDDALGCKEFVPVRKRKPRLQVAFAKTLSQRVVARFLGSDTFPLFKVEENPDDEAFLKAIIKASKLSTRILEPVRRSLNTGSCFVRFYLVDGSIKMEWYHSKYCYPKWSPGGQLEEVRIQYVYEDTEDKDPTGKPKQKWWRMDLNTMSEIKYDNPEYVAGGPEPEFQVVSQVDHEMGFVQGEWLRTCEVQDSPDGYGITEDITSFIDEINYSLSQSSQAVGYNQDPNVWFRGMTEDEMGSLIRSASKSWNLGREGEAGSLETNLTGVERAVELRDKIRLNIQDISRIVLLDPDKIIGSAQSGKAMEILHGPLKDLVDELKPVYEEYLKAIVLKMAFMLFTANAKGIDVPFEIPQGYVPQALASLEIEWRPLFQQTMEDLQKKVQVASAATSASIISRETATRWLAKDFNIENVEEEIQKIASQPVINPFGGF